MNNVRHDEWVRLYIEEGLSAGKIADKFGVTEPAVRAALHKRGVPLRRGNMNQRGEELRRFYPEWAKRYEGGESLKEVADAYGVTAMTVSRALEQMGVERRDYVESHRKYAIRNEHAFDVIDTEHKAYFLGLLMADGCVMVGTDGENSARVALSLQEDDCCLVKALATFLDTDSPIHGKRINNGITKAVQAELQVFSKPLAEGLIRCGCVPRKTKVVQFPGPEIVPGELLGAYARGYFDGNGCVSGRANRPGNVSVMFTTGSQVFAFGMSEACTRIGFPLRVRGYKSGKAFTVASESRGVVERVYHWMYDSATVYLPRKKAKFEELLGLTGSAN